MTFVVLWIGLSLIAGVVASNKGRSFFAFFFLALILSPLIGFIAALIAKPDASKLEARSVEAGEMKKCPACAEMIRAEAKVCRFCQTVQA